MTKAKIHPKRLGVTFKGTNEGWRRNSQDHMIEPANAGLLRILRRRAPPHLVGK